MITRKKIGINFPRSLMMITIGASAFTSGVFFALPIIRQDFARLDFSDVSIAAEIADTPATRMKGLSGVKSLPELQGMLFVTKQADYTGIWMKDMKFPIDILWIENGTVVDMKENIKPPLPNADPSTLPIYRPFVPSSFILEVNAGFSRRHAIHIGDRVNIEIDGKTYAEANNKRETVLVAESPLPPSAGNEYSIDTLHSRVLQGSNFHVGEQIAVNKIYETRAVTYHSGDLTISGVMNVPQEPPPAGGFPVLIVNHGLISPSIYTTGRGSKREQDFFARHSYVTIHPDYRGHASSSPATTLHHDFYVGYTQDVEALLDAIAQSPPPYIDPRRIGIWGHSMGGGIATRIMVLRPEVRAFVLFAPISADVEDNFYELTPEEIEWLHTIYGPAGDPIYRTISPIEYFNDVSAPVQIHHGTTDTAVPLSFSQKIYETLKRFQKPVEFFVYPGEKHEFINDWPIAATRALQFFDKYVKN